LSASPRGVHEDAGNPLRSMTRHNREGAMRRIAYSHLAIGNG
jgi:hypothetical protein